MRIASLIFAGILGIASTATAVAPKGTYLGTSKTTVSYLDPNTLQVVATQVFTCNETIIIAAPKHVGVITEPNPFALTIQATAPKTPPVDGDVKVVSARIYPVTGGSVLVPYWLLQNTATGFVGALDDNHLFDGIPGDRLIANLKGPHGAPTSYRMHDASIGSALQCTLKATVTGKQMALQLTGYAFVTGQAIVQFKTQYNVRRQ